MHTSCALALLLGFAVPAAFAAQAAPSSASPSPAQQHIAAAQRQLATGPKRAQSYTDLALAWIRRARETQDPNLYAKADAAVDAGLLLAPQDFSLAKARVSVLIARQRYTEALAQAMQLHLKDPDDVAVYGYMAECDIALGNYDAADTAAQWMINMRPGNTPGLLAGAQLRVVYGDISGALEFLNQAFEQTPSIEPEEQAWLANRIAMVALDAGRPDDAQHALDRAAQLFPDYPLTLENTACLRLAQHQPAAAVTLLQQRLASEHASQTPDEETLFLLAEAQQAANSADAPAAYSLFASNARAALSKPDFVPAPVVIDLMLYDAGLPGLPPNNPSEALRLATQRQARQHDIATLDAYAWALYANSRYAEAEAAEKQALAVGTLDPRFLEHSGEIALKRNQPVTAQQQFMAAIQADAASPYAAQARLHAGDSSAIGAQPTGQLADRPAGQPLRQQAVAPAGLNAAKFSSATPAVAVPPLEELHDTGALPSALLIPRPTGTESTLHKIQARVTAHPKEAAGYASLGAAFFQRARETGDVEDFQLAEQALNHSLELSSTDISSAAPLATLAEVCMGEHRFTDALNYAQRSLALGSGDISPFAIVGDAYADMGEYEKAGIAYSRLSANPQDGLVRAEAGTGAGSGAPADGKDPRDAYAEHTRTAYLQFIAGDTQAAIAAMKISIGEGVATHLPSENLAWLYFELGEFEFQGGDIQSAADAYLTSLTIYPGDYRALAGLGKVRASQGNFKQAITLYQSAVNIVPMPLYVVQLGDLYARTGDTVDAEKQYKLVEYIGLLGHINQVLHNRDLALFYADHDRNLPEALTLARKEFEVRSDVYTWDALAWALFKNGQLPDAKQAMSHALRLGTRDPMLLFHAGMIDARLGQQAAATQQLQSALSLNPHFSILDAPVALKQLDELRKQPTVAAAAAGADHAQ
jgi:Flp pilus assembly protein TadD